jgi:hypothetical protein
MQINARLQTAALLKSLVSEFLGRYRAIKKASLYEKVMKSLLSGNAANESGLCISCEVLLHRLPLSSFQKMSGGTGVGSRYSLNFYGALSSPSRACVDRDRPGKVGFDRLQRGM